MQRLRGCPWQGDVRHQGQSVQGLRQFHGELAEAHAHQVGRPVQDKIQGVAQGHPEVEPHRDGPPDFIALFQGPLADC